MSTLKSPITSKLFFSTIYFSNFLISCKLRKTILKKESVISSKEYTSYFHYYMIPSYSSRKIICKEPRFRKRFIEAGFSYHQTCPSWGRVFLGEWRSGLSRSDKNRKVPGSNPTRRLVGLRDSTSLRGSRLPLGWNKNAVIYIGSVRLSPSEWLKVDRGAAN